MISNLPKWAQPLVKSFVETQSVLLEIGRYEPPRDRIEMSHLVRSQGILNGPLLFDF